MQSKQTVVLRVASPSPASRAEVPSFERTSQLVPVRGVVPAAARCLCLVMGYGEEAVFS